MPGRRRCIEVRGRRPERSWRPKGRRRPHRPATMNGDRGEGGFKHGFVGGVDTRVGRHFLATAHYLLVSFELGVIRDDIRRLAERTARDAVTTAREAPGRAAGPPAGHVPLGLIGVVS